MCETDLQLSGGVYQLSGRVYQLSGRVYQLSGRVYQLSGSYFQLKRASPQLTVWQTCNSLPTHIPTQSVFPTQNYTTGGANFSLMVRQIFH